jgi:hypothetical protein
VIIGGASDLFEGSLLGVSALSLLNDMKAYLLLVEPWRGEASADAFYGVYKLLGERFGGSVINKVPAAAVNHIKETVRPFLEKKGVPIFGIFPKDRALEAVSVRQLNEILNGKVLCCEDKLDEFVENFPWAPWTWTAPLPIFAGCRIKRSSPAHTAPTYSLRPWRRRPGASF